MHRGSPSLLRGSSPPSFQWSLHLQGTPPAAAKAWPSSAPGPSPPASRRAPPSSATPPTPATPPAQISRSVPPGRNREDTAPLPATRWPESPFLSPAAPAILPLKSAPSIVLRHRRHQPRRKILRQPIQRRVLLFKKAFHVRRNLILIAKQKIICAIQNFPRLALFQRDLAFQGNQHGCRPPRCRIKQQRRRFYAQYLSAQHCIAVRRFGHPAVRS